MARCLLLTAEEAPPDEETIPFSPFSPYPGWGDGKVNISFAVRPGGRWARVRPLVGH